jgi:DNA-binding transcriptional ArsR family regulator
MSNVADFDRVVHEPARLVLVANLSVVEEADFVFLSKQTGLTAGNISFHMAKLEEAGYVQIDKQFVGKKPRTTYRLTSSGREAFVRHRRQLEEVLGVGR